MLYNALKPLVKLSIQGFFRDIHFTKGSILVVFASDIYKEEDYF